MSAGIIAEVTYNDFGSCYFLLESTNWEVAQDEAECLDGNLVTIESQEQDDWLFQQFPFFEGLSVIYS